jgi:hypothetical protein
MIENLSALSGVACEKLGAIFPSFSCTHICTHASYSDSGRKVSLATNCPLVLVFEHGGTKAFASKSHGRSNEDAQGDEPEAFAHDHPKHLRARGAKSHANADLVRAARDDV